MPRIDDGTIERLLRRVQKPARYAGGELHSIVREECRLRVALSYPDLYDVGMSNNGIRILYDIANGIEGVACERVFAVDKDFEDLLREERVPLYTLETRTPLGETDMVGFNISHELLCTGVLQVLDLGNIPLLRDERGEGDPLVIAGGEAVANPLPLFDFIDAFFFGDGEEGIADIINALMEGKSRGLGRKDLLESLSRIDGVLVPACAAGGSGKRVKKRVYRGEPRDPQRPVVPSMRIIQDRAVVEVARGCQNLCKFCHAGYWDLPYRHYDAGLLASRIEAILDNTGYNEVTVSALSVSDYRDLAGLLNLVLPGLTEKGITVSLPSLKVDKDTIPVIELISEVRRTSLTFAVESAVRPMLERANKKVYHDELLQIVRYAFQNGWKVLKLYFMIGLPGCLEHDEAAAIIDLMKAILNKTERRVDLNITISPFVPKPHTPFQRERQMDTEYFRTVLQKIRKGLPRIVNLKNHDFGSSLLEGVITRGDARLGAVILGSYRDGCRLDSWNEHLRIDVWKKNLDALLPGWEEFLGARGDGDALPWAVVDAGFDMLTNKMKDRCADLSPEKHRVRGFNEALVPDAITDAKARFARRYATKARYRLRLSKTGAMKFISHMDLFEIMKRGLRMAQAPLSFTQGFNKREKITTSHPLPLGIESTSEFFDLELHEAADDFLRVLPDKLPLGIGVVSGRFIDVKESLMAVTHAAEYAVDLFREEDYDNAARNLDGRIGFIKETAQGTAEVPFDEAVAGYRVLDRPGIVLVLPVAGKGAMRIDAVMRALTGNDGVDFIKITRTGLLRRTESGLEPIS